FTIALKSFTPRGGASLCSETADGTMNEQTSMYNMRMDRFERLHYPVPHQILSNGLIMFGEFCHEARCNEIKIKRVNYVRWAAYRQMCEVSSFQGQLQVIFCFQLFIITREKKLSLLILSQVFSTKERFIFELRPVSAVDN